MVTRNLNTYRIHSRLGVVTVSDIVPVEDRQSSVVVRWDCRLTLTQGDFTLFEEFQTVPDRPFKPLANYTKLDLQHVIEKLAQSPLVEQFLVRFETAHAQVPIDSFAVSQLLD